MSIRFGLSAALLGAVLLGECATASAQGRGGPGGRGGGMTQGSGTGMRGQGGCSMGSTKGTTGNTMTSARMTSPAQYQYAQLAAQQQSQSFYARYYAEQAEYAVYLQNLMQRHAQARQLRQQ